MGQNASVNKSDVLGKDESSKMMVQKDWKIPPPSNPLLIDLVLDKLPAIVNIKDLPSCRLVCKLWNLQIIPRFRREFDVCVKNGHNRGEESQCLKRYLSAYPEARTKSLKQFVQLMRTTMALPYTKFWILNISANTRLIHEFFSTWGSEFTHLTLKNWTLGHTDIRHWSPYGYSIGGCFFIEDFDELIKFSTNLVYLCIHTRQVFQESYPGPWKPKPRLSFLKMLIFRSGNYSPRSSNQNSKNYGLLSQELRARSPNARIIIEYTD